MRLRVCTWNIQLGARLDRVLDTVAGHPDFAQVDLIALQEASVHQGRDDAESVAAALGHPGSCIQAVAGRLDGLVQANALVWRPDRVAVRSHRVIELPAAADSDLPRAERALLGALPSQRRTTLVVDSDVGGVALRVYVAHLDVLGYQHKRAQFGRIVTDMAASPAELTVIAGDLNTFGLPTPRAWSSIAGAARAAGLTNVTRGVRWTHSIGGGRVRQKLDAIFVAGPPRLTTRAWTLPVDASDHLPVFAELAA